MLLRTVWVVLLAIAGCRSAGGSVSPPAPPRALTSDAPAPPRAPEPATPAEAEAPAPAERAAPFAAEASIFVGVRPVEVRIDEQPAASPDAPPERTLLVSIDGATEGDHLIAIPTGFGACERAVAVVEPVAGEPSPLVLAQAFCENGEDEFSRAIVTAVIDLGDDTSAVPHVTWKGDGSFSSSFGVCMRSDVPVARVARPGILVVEQAVEVVFEPDPDLPEIPCKPKKSRPHSTAEIGF